jgi:uncharacterized membrane protein YjfL (UPF0719 family)
MLQEILQSFGNAAYLVGVLYIVNLIANKRVHFNVTEHIEVKNNFALALRRAGLYIGISIGLLAVIGESYDVIVFDTLLIIGFFFLSLILIDKILLSNINNDEEIEKGNISVGITEFGLFIATGIITYASFNGEGPWYSSIVYFILGQIILFGIFYLVSHKDEIAKNNKASSIYAASILIAYSLILKAAIMGPFISWYTDLTAFAISAVSGVIMLLLLANKVIDKLFLPTSSIKKEIEEENYAALTLIGSLKIAIAIIVSSSVI